LSELRRRLRAGPKEISMLRHVRRFLCIGFGLAALLAASDLVHLRPAHAEDVRVTNETFYNDPDAPTAGNPKGDVTIVAFLDYNCPFCKKSAPALARLIATDHNIRIVYKDWPILAPTSVYGAKLALGAKYQGKYVAAHDALMQLPGFGIAEAKMDEAVRSAGIDIDLLNKDLDRHFDEIVALIRRNDQQAKALGFEGTPVYVVGSIKVPAALDYEGFRKVVAEVRAEQGKSLSR
jgi:protein-disulfide isomerase